MQGDAIIGVLANLNSDVEVERFNVHKWNATPEVMGMIKQVF